MMVLCSELQGFLTQQSILECIETSKILDLLQKCLQLFFSLLILIFWIYLCYYYVVFLFFCRWWNRVCL